MYLFDGNPLQYKGQVYEDLRAHYIWDLNFMLEGVEHGNIQKVVYKLNIKMEDYSLYEEIFVYDDLGYQHYYENDLNKYAILNGDSIY